MDYEIKDISLKEIGKQKIEWVKNFMPVLSMLEKKYMKDQPFKGIKVAMALHLEAKTAYLAKVIKNLGADIRVTGSNPLSTQDEIAAALVDDGLPVFAYTGVDSKTYKKHLLKVLEHKPHIIIDDGADLATTLYKERPDLMEDVYGGCEETTTGVVRVKAMERQGVLKYPVFSINDADCKHLFDNRYGTGQSSLEGVMRATNLALFGKNIVVAGYGWCGRGIAEKGKGFGANIIVTEVDSVKALEASMDGYRVMPMEEAAKIGDVFITATGNIDVITKEHFLLMKDNAVLANAGHFDCEVSVVDLEEIALHKLNKKAGITSYVLGNNRTLNLLGEGRLVNLACSDGHAAEIMDMSFSLQLLSALYLLENHKKLENRLYDVPKEIDQLVADTKLEAMGIAIDRLTKEQKKYLESWE